MASVNDLARALNDVFLDNVIEECVLTFEDDTVSIKAMDLTSSLFVQTTAKLEHEEGQCGIGNLSIFVKLLTLLKDIEVSIKQKENVLTIKPENGALVKYLLAEVDLIPSYSDEWDDNILENELEKYESSLVLKQESVSDFLAMMRLFTPNSVHFKINQKGVVTLHGGSDIEHKFEVKLGKYEDAEPCTVKVYGKHLSPILSAIDFSKNPKLYLQKGESIIITTDVTSWMVQPTSDE